MENIEEQIKNVIHKLRPYLQRDGGDIEYVDFNVRYDKYSSYSMYPFICLPIMETPIMPYRIQKRVYNRGIQEDSFEKMLSRFIKDPYEVKSDIGLVNDIDLCYEPDIAIVHQGHPHVHIDIEIDEPYSVNNEPIKEQIFY